jgi:hypothetical protein
VSSTSPPPNGKGRPGNTGKPEADPPARPWQPPNASRTPNAEKYLLEADALRRRQLRSALLHGSHRTWRDQARTWPAMVAGVVLVAVILTAIKVVSVYDHQPRQNSPGVTPTSPTRTVGTAVPSRTP